MIGFKCDLCYRHSIAYDSVRQKQIQQITLKSKEGFLAENQFKILLFSKKKGTV